MTKRTVIAMLIAWMLFYACSSFVLWTFSPFAGVADWSPKDRGRLLVVAVSLISLAALWVWAPWREAAR